MAATSFVILMDMGNSKNILILCGHPDKDSLSGLMADHYQASAEDAGHEVARVNVGELQFDPVLQKGYKEIQALEPDLIDLQEKIRNADHLVVVYPNWWCSMPAPLKGVFDRIWLPGFAFNFNKRDRKPERLLAGKSARVIITIGSQTPFKTWWQFGDFTNEIQYAILEFAGIGTAVSTFGPSDNIDEVTEKKWLKEIDGLGKRGV